MLIAAKQEQILRVDGSIAGELDADLGIGTSRQMVKALQFLT
jgi:hypothetical protein